MRRSGITSRATRTGAATTGASLSIRRTGSSTPFSGIRSRSAKTGPGAPAAYDRVWLRQPGCVGPRARTTARRAHGTYRRCASRRWNNSISCAGWPGGNCRSSRRPMTWRRSCSTQGRADGWKIHGKTGTGSPGSFGDYDREHAYGWYVGWARKNGRELVFARLIQDEGGEAERRHARASNCWPGCRAGWARPDSAEAAMIAHARDARIDMLRGVSILLVLLHHFNIPYSLKDTGLAALLGWPFLHALAQRQLWRDDVLRGVGFPDHAQRAGQMGRAGSHPAWGVLRTAGGAHPALLLLPC